VVSNKEKECLIFDPGEQGEALIKELRRLQVKPLAIILTHAHFDHIGAVDVVRTLLIFRSIFIRLKKTGFLIRQKMVQPVSANCR
jgi:glyoxylase-like metal-dependent hydrolase (beta-lactamase superfamily II)